MGKCLKKTCFIIIIMVLMCVKCIAITEDDELFEQYMQGAPDSFEYSEDTDSYSGLEEKLDIGEITDSIIKVIKSQLKNCISLFVAISVVILLFAVVDSFEFNTSKSISVITSAVISMTVLLICFATIKSNIDVIKDSVESMKVFTTAAVPVITTLCITSADTFSGALFSASASLSSTIFEYISQNLILPLSILYLSFGIIGNISQNYSVISINTYIKRFIKWAIGIFAGIFTASFSLQSFVSHSSDTLMKRSIKTAVGSFIPVVGSTLSGGIDSVFVLAANSKTSFAVLGIVIIIFIFLPPVAGNVCYGISVTAAKALASFLGVSKAESTLGVIADTFFMLAGICGACVFMVIVSFLIICINIG